MAETKIGRVLIVEDEPLEQIALCGNVKKIYQDKLEILTAEDGIEAKRICAERKPDIALVDINIPGISGLELIHFLVEQKFAGKILIITAYDTSDYIRQALTLGVTDYLLKPVAAKELKEAIDKCMELLRRDKEQREKEISSSIVSCYAEQYLVSDIMKGRYPKLTLEEAYHWEKNGRLNVYVAGIAGRDVPEIFKDTDTAGIWSKYFWTVCGKVEEVTFLFLHPRLWVEQSELIVILQTGMKILSRKIKEGRIVVSIPAATYEQLGEICDRIVRTIKKKKEGVWMEPTAWENETDRVNGKKLCRKWEQRLRENNAENFTRMFRRKA